MTSCIVISKNFHRRYGFVYKETGIKSIVCEEEESKIIIVWGKISVQMSSDNSRLEKYVDDGCERGSWEFISLF